MSIRVAVLTVSDTAFQDASADKSGPAIKQMLLDRGFQCTSIEIVPDDESRIQAFIKRLSHGREVDWIVTTGGTGFGIRDRTPEAISPLLDRHAPGLTHLMLSNSLHHTPLAALSRPIAGTIKDTLIVTLPGSLKAVKENMEALLSGGIVEHAIDLIKGGTGKDLHALLAAKDDSLAASPRSGHIHEHHHHHSQPHTATSLSKDPSLPVSSRLRNSPYQLITPESALQCILTEISPLSTHKLPVSHKLAVHVLAEDVYAPQNVPPTKTTNVDGYALRSTDPPSTYKVTTLYNADTLPGDSIYRINTGAPLPPGTDSVIMVEDTKLVATHSNGEEHEVETLVQTMKGENVRQVASDVRKGELVMRKGEVVGAKGGEIGTLVFVGRKEVEVYRKPIVALMSTGNEIIDCQSSRQVNVDGAETWGGIWDTNRPSLHAALRGIGYDIVDLGILRDDIQSHVSALRNGLDKADIVITTGGTSMGPTDLLKPVIEHHFGGRIHFGRVSAKPGKPTTFASIEGEGGKKKYVFALPGNPASALVMFYVFVLPALRRLGGWSVDMCQLPRVWVKLKHAMPLDPRTEYHRVIVQSSRDGLTAESTGGQRSSRVASLSGANGLVVLPPKKEGGVSEMRGGEMAEAILIGELVM